MEIFEEIKYRVSMRDVLEHYGVRPVRGTNIYRCFLHDDSRPSANTFFDKKCNCYKFHCFPCNWTGDIFDVVEHFEKCNRKESMKIIDHKFGLGLYKQLSHKEKLELARKQRERERQKAEKLAWQKYEIKVLGEIADALRVWEEIERDNHITRGEYRNNTWSPERQSMFFTALKQQEWLTWLYDTISGFKHPECEFNCIYGTDKDTILKMIRKKEISL